MKILVFSDSHNHAYRIEKALLNETEVDLIIHLGDCISDIQSIQAKYPQFKYEFIPGNRDYNYNIPEEIMLEVEGKNFFITHSSKYFTQINLNHFFEFTSNIDADVILYGHTHVAKKFVHDGILYLNPGCMSSPPNRGIKTYMVINIEDGQIDTKLVDIEYLNKKSSSFNRPMKLLKIDIKKLGCTMLVFLAGELDHQTSDIVRTKIDGELISNAGGIKNLILDCSKVGYYDSLGIGVIIGSQRKFAKLGGKTAVVGMNPQTRRVLELTGFKGIIPFFDSIDDAFEYFGARVPLCRKISPPKTEKRATKIGIQGHLTS